jgi:hypothetical protein
MRFEQLPRTEDEILEHVYRRAAQIRRPRMIAHVMLSVLMVSMLGGGTVLAMHRGQPVEPAHDGGTPTLVDDDEKKEPKPERKKEATKPEPEPTKEPADEPKDKPEKEPVKDEPKDEPKDEQPFCFNSFDPACGDFYWKTYPGTNQALSLDVDASEAIVGQETSFTVSVSDADAKIWREAYKIDFGDGTKLKGGADWWACKKGYGKWSVPTKGGDSYSKTFTHTYTAAGTYKAWVYFRSKDVRDGASPCQQAYGSEKIVEVTIVVSEPAPEPSPS